MTHRSLQGPHFPIPEGADILSRLRDCSAGLKSLDLTEQAMGELQHVKPGQTAA